MVKHQWHDPYYEPLWNALENLNLALGFHESTGTGKQQIGERLEPNLMLRRVYAQPMEQMLALGSFCAGGVLARHPKLRVAFLEANCSWLPWLLWRLDEGWEREGDVWAPDVTKPPSEYMRSEQVYYSFEPDEHTLNFVMDYVGEDRLVFASDYNHGDSKFPHTVESVTERKNLSASQLRKLMCDNAARLYNI